MFDEICPSSHCKYSLRQIARRANPIKHGHPLLKLSTKFRHLHIIQIFWLCDSFYHYSKMYHAQKRCSRTDTSLISYTCNTGDRSVADTKHWDSQFPVNKFNLIQRLIRPSDLSGGEVWVWQATAFRVLRVADSSLSQETFASSNCSY